MASNSTPIGQMQRCANGLELGSVGRRWAEVGSLGDSVGSYWAATTAIRSGHAEARPKCLSHRPALQPWLFGHVYARRPPSIPRNVVLLRQSFPIRIGPLSR